MTHTGCTCTHICTVHITFIDLLPVFFCVIFLKHLLNGTQLNNDSQDLPASLFSRHACISILKTYLHLYSQDMPVSLFSRPTCISILKTYLNLFSRPICISVLKTYLYLYSQDLLVSLFSRPACISSLKTYLYLFSRPTCLSILKTYLSLYSQDLPASLFSRPVCISIFNTYLYLYSQDLPVPLFSRPTCISILNTYLYLPHHVAQHMLPDLLCLPHCPDLCISLHSLTTNTAMELFAAVWGVRALVITWSWQPAGRILILQWCNGITSNVQHSCCRRRPATCSLQCKRWLGICGCRCDTGIAVCKCRCHGRTGVCGCWCDTGIAVCKCRYQERTGVCGCGYQTGIAVCKCRCHGRTGVCGCGYHTGIGVCKCRCHGRTGVCGCWCNTGTAVCKCRCHRRTEVCGCWCHTGTEACKYGCHSWTGVCGCWCHTGTWVCSCWCCRPPVFCWQQNSWVIIRGWCQQNFILRFCFIKVLHIFDWKPVIFTGITYHRNGTTSPACWGLLRSSLFTQLAWSVLGRSWKLNTHHSCSQAFHSVCVQNTSLAWHAGLRPKVLDALHHRNLLLLERCCSPFQRFFICLTSKGACFLGHHCLHLIVKDIWNEEGEKKKKNHRKGFNIYIVVCVSGGGWGGGGERVMQKEELCNVFTFCIFVMFDWCFSLLPTTEWKTKMLAQYIMFTSATHASLVHDHPDDHTGWLCIKKKRATTTCPGHHRPGQNSNALSHRLWTSKCQFLRQ